MLDSPHIQPIDSRSPFVFFMQKMLENDFFIFSLNCIPPPSLLVSFIKDYGMDK